MTLVTTATGPGRTPRGQESARVGQKAVTQADS